MCRFNCKRNYTVDGASKTDACIRTTTLTIFIQGKLFAAIVWVYEASTRYVGVLQQILRLALEVQHGQSSNQ